MFETTENISDSSNRTQINSNATEACVNCKHRDFRRTLDGYDFDSGELTFFLETCQHCQLTRTAPLLSDTDLSRFYQPSYYGTSEKKFNPLIEKWTVWSNNRLARKILSSYENSRENLRRLKVLDIGCGRANLLKAFNRLGCDCYGIERESFPSDTETSDLTILKQDLLDAPFENNSFDIIVIWHVLEHMVNPATALQKVREILKPDGLLVIAVPNFGGTQGKLFGKHWFHLDLPRHTYHFSRKSLSALLTNNGLSIRSTSTSCPDQSIFGFIQSSLNCIPVKDPNILYSILKTAQNRPGIYMTLLQIMIAGILFPLGVLEYLLSTACGLGACLIVSAGKNPEKEDNS